MQEHPPPISTVEVPILRKQQQHQQQQQQQQHHHHHQPLQQSQQHPLSVGHGNIANRPPHQPQRGPPTPTTPTVTGISSLLVASGGGPLPTIQLPQHAQQQQQQQQTMPYVSDQRTHFSNDTGSTSGSFGGGSGAGAAFPSADFALQLQRQQQNQIFAEVHRYMQQQHASTTVQVPTPPNNPEPSPWTLGSTDGTYALSLLLQESPRQQHQRDNITATNGTAAGPAALAGGGVPPEVAFANEVAMKLQMQQQQQQQQPHSIPQKSPPAGSSSMAPPASTGAAIASTGEADNNDHHVLLHIPDNLDGRDSESDNSPPQLRMKQQYQYRPEQPQQQQQQPLSQHYSLHNKQEQPYSVEGNSTDYTNPLLASARITRDTALLCIQRKISFYQERLFRQPSSAVEACLAAACEVMNFDIAEMWLRTGPKTHQLTNSHLRPSALEDSVRKDLVDVYYGDKSSERTHRLSPALCKRAKEAADVVWVTALNPASSDALRCSISNVRTAVAVPVCHQASNTNITILFFSIRKIIVRPESVEFLVHMSLAAGVASVNSLSDEGLMNRDLIETDTSQVGNSSSIINNKTGQISNVNNNNGNTTMLSRSMGASNRSPSTSTQRIQQRVSVTGAPLDLQWRQLSNVEYLTDGGNSWIHTAVYHGKPVVVKTLKPECQDVALAINEIEGELSIHSKLNHVNIVALLGAGLTSKGVRFFVLERLDGGTLTQMIGYETRIRDRRRRFWRRKLFSFLDVLRIARSIAEAMCYCHEQAIPDCIILHRDLKPDNIGFTLDGTVKLIDFGLAKVIEKASVDSQEVYQMSGETGSLRYMAPEVADGLPYNYSADVYSFGIILWELNASKKPYEGLTRDLFYERVVHGGERPPLGRKWPTELTSLMIECWDADMLNRPKFRDIVKRLDAMLMKEKGVGRLHDNTKNTSSHHNNKDVTQPSPGNKQPKKLLPKLTGLIDRHSTWF